LWAQALANGTSGFFEIKGASDGDSATALLTSQLRATAEKYFGQDYSEAMACRQAKFAFDFYFLDEATVVEIAAGSQKSKFRGRA